MSKIILIGGGSASGKTFVLKKVLEKIPADKITVISIDDYYKDFSVLPFEERAKINFDHPKAFDWKLMNEQIRALKNGQTIEKPIYDFTIHGRSPKTEVVDPKELNTKIGKYESADIIDINLKDSDYGLVACLYDKKGKLLSSNIYRSKKDKEFKYPNVNIKLNQISDWELEISSDKFARAVHLNLHDNDVVFSDNYFDLLANTTIHISSSKPIKVEDIEIECVNNY